MCLCENRIPVLVLVLLVILCEFLRSEMRKVEVEDPNSQSILGVAVVMSCFVYEEMFALKKLHNIVLS